MPMYEKPRKYTKMVASTIVGSSTYYVVKTVLRNNMPMTEEEKKTTKVKASIGSGVIALIVAERTSIWTDDLVDTIFNAFDWSPKPELEEFVTPDPE
jgi:hypothetical protein